MGHDDVRAAMIYQHAVRGADKPITEAIDKHLIGHEWARDEGDHEPRWHPEINSPMANATRRLSWPRTLDEAVERPTERRWPDLLQDRAPYMITE